MSQRREGAAVGASMFTRIGLVAAAMSISATSQAQAPESPVSVTGQIISVGETAVVLQTPQGRATVAMMPHWTLGKARVASPASIKPGDFVATTNANVDVDTGRASEVRIFEPGYEPEHGTHPIPRPNTSMTHGRVGLATASNDGVTIIVTYSGGMRHIQVAADTKVTAYDVVDRRLAAPGVTVNAVTRRDSDGVPRAGRLLLVTP